MAMENRIPDLSIEGAQLIFKNFSGKPTDVNPKGGDRTFAVKIDDVDLAADLAHQGWNIKVRPNDKAFREQCKMIPDFDGKLQFCIDNGILEDTLLYLQANARYEKVPPAIYQIAGRTKKAILLREDEIGRFDHADITHVDLILHPYTWVTSRGSGVTAYVKSMYVTIQQDLFAEKYDIDTEDM